MSLDDVARTKRVEELLERFVEQHVLHGVTPDPVDLCRDSPELLGPLREQIRKYEGLNHVLASPEDLQPGQRLLHYRIIEKLGEGGMGQVYLAEDEKLGRRVALKLLPPEMARDRELLERFRREARTVAALNHPNIVTIHAVEESRGLQFLVMELIEGKTLASSIGEGGMPVTELFDVAIPVAAALSAAHERRIVHRDLKPNNVMVTGDGLVKVLDFGLAKLVQEGGAETTSRASTEMLTGAGRILGTLPYMSPEQLEGGAIDARSDVFSFGVMLYQMATGKRPFVARSQVAMITAILVDTPRPATQLRAELPADLDRILERCLEKAPEQRWRSAAVLTNELRDLKRKVEAGEALPPKTAAVPVPRSPSPRGRRPRRWWPALAALAGAAVVVAAVFLLPQVRNRISGAQVSAPSEESISGLSEYQLYQQGLAALERFDKKNKLDLAIESFKRILARNPEHAAGHAGLGKAYWVQSKYGSRDSIWLDLALPLAERAVELDENLAIAHVTLGLVLTSLGRLDAARRELNRALVLNPSEAEAYRGIAEIHKAQGQRNAAEAALREAIRLSPDRSRYYVLLGNLLARESRLSEAEALYLKSIDQAPDGSRGYSNLAFVRYKQGQLEEAIGLLQKAIEFDPQPGLYTNLGFWLFHQGRYVDALTPFKRAIDSGGANNYRYWGNLADAYRMIPGKEEDARTNYKVAIGLLREKIEMRPQDKESRSLLASYLAKRGDFQEALSEMKGIEISQASSATTLRRLVQSYEICREREPALEALREALRANEPVSTFKEDPELVGLRSDPRYHLLVAEAESL